MKIVIIGLGTVGKTVLKNLSGKGHTITIIDEDKDKIESLIERYKYGRYFKIFPIFAQLIGKVKNKIYAYYQTNYRQY